MKVLVTGGAGFIGSHLVDLLIKEGHGVTIVDSLTYAGDIKNINPRAAFYYMNICSPDIRKVIKGHHWVFHLAAETHVDNSIKNPEEFIKTNVFGTYNILQNLQGARLIHVSTDEVYGSLDIDDKPFTETHPYKPSSPYSASKASSDLLVKSYVKTYGIDAVVTNCSNNYGPRQNKEKFIPKVIDCIENVQKIPLYGDGRNIRDWISVYDHCEALLYLAWKGVKGESYNIGANQEKSNLDIIHTISKLIGKTPIVSFVEDRPGHDFRYAIDSTKLSKLGWTAKRDFDSEMKYLLG